MLSDLVVEENRPTLIDLSPQQASLLRDLGKRMAGRIDWWGAADVDGAAEADGQQLMPSVVKVEQGPNTTHWVTFRNVMGAVNVGGLQLEIRPKIPLLHFRHLLKQADISPRLDERRLQLDEDVELHELLCGWFLMEAERLVRLGLNRDYSDYEDAMTEVRGSLSIVPTVLANLSGRAVAHCIYSDLDEDTSLNRILKAACLTISRNTDLPMTLRRRASRLTIAMGPVGSLRNDDRLANVTRLTARYGRALPLARLVLVSAGISARTGDCAASGFLVPTPGIVESGLRNLISKAVHPLSVTKRGMRLAEGGLTLNPDLVIDCGRIVGDVKYRLFGDAWDRSSFNQIVTFASGYGSEKGLIVGFSRGRPAMGPLAATIGQVGIRKFSWAVSANDDPVESERRLLAEIAEWVV